MTDEDCAACDFNKPGKTCLRKMTWEWRGTALDLMQFGKKRARCLSKRARCLSTLAELLLLDVLWADRHRHNG